MCGLKFITSCPEYAHRFPGCRVVSAGRSVSPLADEAGGAARAEVERLSVGEEKWHCGAAASLAGLEALGLLKAPVLWLLWV